MSGFSLDEVAARLKLNPDQQQILAHEQVAVLDIWFNESNFITLAPNAVQSVVVSYTLPSGMLGILRAVAMQTEDDAALNNVIWQVRFNRAPIPGLDRIRGPMSTFLFPLPWDTAIYDGYTVDIVASNLSAVEIPGTWGMVRGTFFGRSLRS